VRQSTAITLSSNSSLESLDNVPGTPFGYRVQTVSGQTVFSIYFAFVDIAPPRVTGLQFNVGLTDPPDRPSGGQLTSWDQQRSELRRIQVSFSEPVIAAPEALQLINLGIDAPTDGDTPIVLDQQHLTIVDNTLTIEFGPGELPDGVYSLAVLPTLTDLAGKSLDGDEDGQPGGEFRYVGNSSNGFYQLGGDFNGDGQVSIFDFPIFAYWFGTDVADQGAPSYADLNADGGITIFDFAVFAARFSTEIVDPSQLTGENVPHEAFAAPPWIDHRETTARSPTAGSEHAIIEQRVARIVTPPAVLPSDRQGSNGIALRHSSRASHSLDAQSQILDVRFVVGQAWPDTDIA
jgi:hypothetical protein